MKILKIDKVKAISNIAFWNWQKSQECKLAALEESLQLNHSKRTQYYSFEQVMGLLFHFLFESHLRGFFEVTDYSSYLKEINQFKLKIKGKFPSASIEDISNLNQIDDFFDYFANQKPITKGPTTSSNESLYDTALWSHSKNLKGKPDLIIKKGSHYQIVEFKSGNIFKENQLKQEYINQLHFYSYLATENYQAPPQKIILKSFTQGTHEVIYSPNLAEEIATNAEKTLKEINNFISETSFNPFSIASASLSSCQYCNLKPICEKFKNLVGAEAFEESIYSFSGIISFDETFNGLQYCKVLLKNENECVSVLNVPVNFLKGLQQESLVSLINLKRISSKSFQFERFSKFNIYD